MLLIVVHHLFRAKRCANGNIIDSPLRYYDVKFKIWWDEEERESSSNEKEKGKNNNFKVVKFIN